MAQNVKGTMRLNNFVWLSVHEKRILDAHGPDVIKYIDDFVHIPVDDTTGDPTAWTTTVVEAGTGDSTATSANIAGGGLLLTTAANENDGINLQLNGESFELSGSATHFYAGIRFKINDVTQTDFFAGLAITDTDILGGVTDRIGFQSLDGSTDIKAMVEKDSTETLSDAIGTLVDDTWHIAEMYYDGSSIEVFFDGVSAGTLAVTNLPDDEELRPSIHFLTGEAVANTMTIDWMRFVQIGGRAA